MLKKIVFNVLFCFISLILGVSFGFASDGKVYQFKMGTTQPPESITTIGAQKMADLVAEKTGGRVKISVYPSMQLGDPKAQAEGLKMGTMDSAWASSAALSPFIPEMNVLSMPYLFKDRAHVARNLNGKAGKMLATAAEKQNVIILGWGENGFRQISNNKKPVVKPDDLSGVKLRVYPTDLYIATFQSLGATVVPLSLSELYIAMQTGAVDGQENAVDLVSSNKFYEVQKYLTMSNHIYGDWGIAFNLRKFKLLPKDLQEIVRQCAVEAAEFQIKIAAEGEEKQKEFLKSKGMQIDEISSYEAWKSKVKPVFDKFGARYADILKVIN